MKLDIVRTGRYERGKRGGMFALVGVELAEEKEGLPVVRRYDVFLSEGETEITPPDCLLGDFMWRGMSGCEKYERAYKTCGGWWSIKSQLVDGKCSCFVYDYIGEHEEVGETEANLFVSRHMDEILRLVLSKLSYYEMAQLEGVLASDVRLARFLPMIWYRKRCIERKGIIYKYFEESTYAEISFRNSKVTLKLPKLRRPVINTRGSLLEIFETVGKQRVIYIKEEQEQEKVVVYVLYPYRDVVEGYEYYAGQLHDRCLINIRDIVMQVLLERRLGDLIFLSYGVDGLELAEESHLEKLQVISGEIDKVNKVVKGDRVVMYHPEHGTLVLPAGSYYIYQVPYLRRGHD